MLRKELFPLNHPKEPHLQRDRHSLSHPGGHSTQKKLFHLQQPEGEDIQMSKLLTIINNIHKD